MLNAEQLNAFFDQTVLRLGSLSVSLADLLLLAGALVVLVFAFSVWAALRTSHGRAVAEAAAQERAREAEARMAELVASQNELTGRMQTMSEFFNNRQSDLMKQVNEKLDGVSGKVSQSISETRERTHKSLSELQERLAVIDRAQNNITSLAGQVVELQNILSNKQTRGAFGEGRMQQIVRDGLPLGTYEFQCTLSNSSRPDCIIHMPNDTPPLVIDAKFPLESWNAIRNAESAEIGKQAVRAFRRDVEVHIRAISEKYLLKGETQDTAFMFVPSESIFAEIHENFENLVQKAHKARVVIVSPSLLMLSIQVMQSVLKDVRMREQAHLIQREIVTLMEDVGRLDDRVRKLDTHFRQAQKDVGDILISSEKVTKRGSRITDLEFENPEAIENEARPKLKAVE